MPVLLIGCDPSYVHFMSCHHLRDGNIQLFWCLPSSYPALLTSVPRMGIESLRSQVGGEQARLSLCKYLRLSRPGATDQVGALRMVFDNRLGDHAVCSLEKKESKIPTEKEPPIFAQVSCISSLTADHGARKRLLSSLYRITPGTWAPNQLQYRSEQAAADELSSSCSSCSVYAILDLA